MKTIKVSYKGYESRSRIDSVHESIESAKESLQFTMKSIIKHGGEIIEQTDESFTFINDDHSNTEITFYI